MVARFSSWFSFKSILVAGALAGVFVASAEATNYPWTPDFTVTTAAAPLATTYSDLTLTVTTTDSDPLIESSGGVLFFGGDGIGTTQPNHVLTVAKTDGSTFTPASLVLALQNFDSSAATVTVTGYSGSTVVATQTYLLAGSATVNPTIDVSAFVQITSLTIDDGYESAGIGTFVLDTNPAFVTASPAALSVNFNTATSLAGVLHVNDPDSGQTETWSSQTAPAHGVLAFSGATASSGSANITPGGAITYTPTTGYVGTDSFAVRVSDGAQTATQTVNVTVTTGTQTIFFPAPVGGVVGSPVTLSATASSGLPITYTLAGGNATLVGNIVTPLDINPVAVQASQPGNSNFSAAAPITRVITPTAKISQTITAGPLPTAATTAKAFTLSATASSGLPVTYTVASGPALSNGATITPTGAAGTVVIMLSQAGNASYAAAPNVSISVGIAPVGPRVFFGTFSITTASSGATGAEPRATVAGSIAASLNAANTAGTLMGSIGGSAFVVNLTIAADGAFTAATTAIAVPGSTVTGPLTFSGSLNGNVITGTIAELKTAFTVTADPAAGSSSAIAGYYQAAALDSFAGATYAMIGTQGEVLVMVVSPTQIVSGTGTVAANNTFTAQAGAAVLVTGSINPAATTVMGTVVTSGGGTGSFSGLEGTTLRTDRLINLSSRGTVSGSNVLVSGLVIGGPASKTVLLRAVGPGLSPFGIPGVLAQPHLQLFDSTGKILSDTTAWGGGSSLLTAFSLTGAFPLAATGADAAVLVTLAPGQYTIQVGNAGTDAGGVALAEIFDASANPSAEYQRLINISSRAFVGSGGANLTGGFIVTGNDPKKVLIRGVGPGLTGFGFANALADPILTVFDSTDTIIAQNDNWGTPVTVNATQVAAAASDITAADLATGAFTLTAGSKDAALIVTLPPGAYTAQVTGAGGASGTALVEIYEIPQ